MYLYIYKHICIYIYVYIHLHTYIVFIHVCTYTHIALCVQNFAYIEKEKWISRTLLRHNEGNSGFWMMDWVDLSAWYLMVSPGGTWAGRTRHLDSVRTASLATSVKKLEIQDRKWGKFRWYGFLMEPFCAPKHATWRISLGMMKNWGRTRGNTETAAGLNTPDPNGSCSFSTIWIFWEVSLSQQRRKSGHEFHSRRWTKTATITRLTTGRDYRAFVRAVSVAGNGHLLQFEEGRVHLLITVIFFLFWNTM
jgi:hypothetical protein